MRNKYVDKCYRCGEMVPIGAGFFETVDKNNRRRLGLEGTRRKWVTQHAHCAIKYRGTQHTYWNPTETDNDEWSAALLKHLIRSTFARVRARSASIRRMFIIPVTGVEYRREYQAADVSEEFAHLQALYEILVELDAIPRIAHNRVEQLRKVEFTVIQKKAEANVKQYEKGEK